MTDELPPELRANVMLARGLLGKVETGDHSGAPDVDWPADLAPEDRRRLEERRAAIPAFFKALKERDRAKGEAEYRAAQGKVDALLKASKAAGDYLGYSEAAEALARAQSLEAFKAALPHVDLTRTYGNEFRKASPFPLIWAVAARSGQGERLQLMLDHGAPVYLMTRMKTTVLHAFAKMNRKAKTRRDLLQMLVDHGANLSARDIEPICARYLWRNAAGGGDQSGQP